MPIISMIFKEIFVGITGFIAIKKSGKVSGADWHGKVATILLYSMMVLHMFWLNIPNEVSSASILLCTSMIFVSFFFYIIKNLKTIKFSDTHANKKQ